MEAVPPETVVLREVAPDDLPIFYEHQRDPVACAMAGFPARDPAAHHAHWARILADSTKLARTVEVSGRVAGNLVSWEQDGRRAVGYWLGRDHWGRGIATRALAAFVAQIPERPLVAFVAEHNRASIRVLEKVGFVPAPAAGEPADGVDEVVLELRA